MSVGYPVRRSLDLIDGGASEPVDAHIYSMMRKQPYDTRGLMYMSLQCPQTHRKGDIRLQRRMDNQILHSIYPQSYGDYQIKRRELRPPTPEMRKSLDKRDIVCGKHTPSIVLIKDEYKANLRGIDHNTRQRKDYINKSMSVDQLHSESAILAHCKTANTYTMDIGTTAIGRELHNKRRPHHSQDRLECFDFGITRSNNHYSNMDKLTRSDAYYIKPRLAITNNSVKTLYKLRYCIVALMTGYMPATSTTSITDTSGTMDYITQHQEQQQQQHLTASSSSLCQRITDFLMRLCIRGSDTTPDDDNTPLTEELPKDANVRVIEQEEALDRAYNLPRPRGDHPPPSTCVSSTSSTLSSSPEVKPVEEGEGGRHRRNRRNDNGDETIDFSGIPTPTISDADSDDEFFNGAINRNDDDDESDKVSSGSSGTSEKLERIREEGRKRVEARKRRRLLEEMEAEGNLGKGTASN
ncbi:hypothetical protein FOL47_008276 [Perkinsus chesapeaki]|uniref:Uncharacterized protein n=1 Tax=Perkinsus chesapeaki TaxID=330153 RepID=A0A7J6MW39_PERCH|nr:hypothetical protein FOL47_008276 [Perkinsus chesapeaki]